MISMDDLKIVDQYVDDVDNTVWAHVEFGDKRYILTSTNVTDDVLDRMTNLDIMSAAFYGIGLFPRKDNAVFYGDENWNIAGECGPKCEEGICTKRIAEDHIDNPTIQHSFDMLLRFLNN